MCCMIFCAFIIISQHFQIPCPLELSMPDSYWHFMLENTSACHFWNEGKYTEVQREHFSKKMDFFVIIIKIKIINYN